MDCVTPVCDSTKFDQIITPEGTCTACKLEEKSVKNKCKVCLEREFFDEKNNCKECPKYQRSQKAKKYGECGSNTCGVRDKQMEDGTCFPCKAFESVTGEFKEKCEVK